MPELKSSAATVTERLADAYKPSPLDPSLWARSKPACCEQAAIAAVAAEVSPAERKEIQDAEDKLAEMAEELRHNTCTRFLASERSKIEQSSASIADRAAKIAALNAKETNSSIYRQLHEVEEVKETKRLVPIATRVINNVLAQIDAELERLSGEEIPIFSYWRVPGSSVSEILEYPLRKIRGTWQYKLDRLATGQPAHLWICRDVLHQGRAFEPRRPVTSLD